ncbi:DUF3168 domain-containing protein [Halalkalibacter alkalisediminis]|uniref:DUF3168 domain-containing protein n=1 Tax=Halalkalibacter alkalisediminis TaxID=935616 RepID=A0ABV6NHS7_9BACI|nr:DUF3168 domain-containing protein [Halalkalibacter alkalisediminis]
MTKLYDAQVSVFKRLESNLELMEQITDTYDYVPSETDFPYIVLGRAYSTPEKTKTTDGERIEITLDIWSIYQGKKETVEIMKLVEASLIEDLLIEDALVISQEVKSREVLEEANDLYHGTVIFEILLDLE